MMQLGARRTISGKAAGRFDMPLDDLLTHGAITGMTGSGKTGLLTVMVEELLRNQVPVLLLDIKGDLPNLGLCFSDFSPERMTPWIEPARGDRDGVVDASVVEAAAAKRKAELLLAGIGEHELREYVEGTHFRIITPGSDAGESLHLLSGLERRSSRWDTDLYGARDTLGAAVSMVLGLIGREADPGKSREHALLSTLAERRLISGAPSELAALLPDILTPPVTELGALPIDAYIGAKQRADLAADLNNLLASPSFGRWRQGQDLDVGKWMEPVGGKTPATIVSVAHLDEENRGAALQMILEAGLSWVRSLPGTSRLRGVIVFDEIYGYLPPHPRNPPTKRPLVSLIKQARAYGVGCLLATQNPMDLDYRALSNAGLWMLGRLQTDADRARVIEGLGEDKKRSEIAQLLKIIGQRYFVVRTAKGGLSLLHPRWAMSLLRGPMTPAEIKRCLSW
jgi:hypothetical protein